MSLLIVSRIFVAVNDYPSGDILLGSKVCRDPGSREERVVLGEKGASSHTNYLVQTTNEGLMP
jgi:hypothetical protein